MCITKSIYVFGRCNDCGQANAKTATQFRACTSHGGKDDTIVQLRPQLGCFHRRGFDQHVSQSVWAENRQHEGSCDECRDVHDDEAEEYTNEEQVEAQQIYHGHGEASGQAQPSPWGFAPVGEVDSENGDGDGSVEAEETVSEPDAGELAFENDDDDYDSIHLSELEPPTDDDDDRTDYQTALVNQPDAAMRQHPYILRMDELAAQMRYLQKDIVEVEGLADLMNYRDLPSISDMTPSQLQEWAAAMEHGLLPYAGQDYAGAEEVPGNLDLFENPFNSNQRISLNYVRSVIMTLRALAERQGPEWPKDSNGNPIPLPDRTIDTHSDRDHENPDDWVNDGVNQYDDGFAPEDPEHGAALLHRRQQGITYDNNELQAQAETTPYDASAASMFEPDFSARTLARQATALTGIDYRRDGDDPYERYRPYIGENPYTHNVRTPGAIDPLFRPGAPRSQRANLRGVYNKDEVPYLAFNAPRRARAMRTMIDIAREDYVDPHSSHGSSEAISAVN